MEIGQVSDLDITDMLMQSGRLCGGRVSESTRTPSGFVATMSKIFELELTYSEDSSGPRPAHCLLKVVEPALFRIGRSEVGFYEFANAQASSQPAVLAQALPEIYGTMIDEEHSLAAVLLQDMRRASGVDAKFLQSDWPVPFQVKDCERAVRALARIHAHWWGSADTEAERLRRLPLQQEARNRIVHCADALIEKLGDSLSQPRRALIERLAHSYPEKHASRLAASGRQTVVHGDAHLWNFLIPADESIGPTLIDWQLWGVDFGAADLAYMMALHWFPERRGRFEQPLVAAYVEALQTCGVDCDYQDIWSDYRFMVAGLLTKVVVYASVIPASIWWPHLERAFAAFEDLDCEGVLGG